MGLPLLSGPLPVQGVALFLGSLVNYCIVETFLGESPARVDEERMIAAWAHNAYRALRAE